MSSSDSYREGRYLYCVVNNGRMADFGHMGIEGNHVYTVPFDDIGAVVHRCEAKPYTTKDTKIAEEWILTHQCVIDLVTREFGTVIPLAFDTIFKGGDQTVKEWLREEYDQLRTLLAKLQGKAEYGIQIFLEKDLIEKATGENEGIQSLRREIEKRSEGAAYLLKKKFEKRLELERRTFIDKHAKSLYDEIVKFAEDVGFGPSSSEVPEKWKGRQMILNLACLALEEDVQQLGKMLGEINNREGFAVRFTGPWSPYSFVGRIKNQKAK